MKDKDGLTVKQRAFCLEYLVDLNGTQAAIRAGYSLKTAKNQATENMSKPAIKVWLEQALAKREAKIELKGERVLAELMALAFAELEKDSLHQLQSERIQANRALEIEAKVPLSKVDLSVDVLRKIRKDHGENRLKALELLGKHHKLWADTTVNNSTSTTTNLQVNAQLNGLTTEQLVALAKSQMKPVEQPVQAPALEPGDPQE